LAAMVERLADGLERGPAFREWLRRQVRFCSSLVDRITTGTPARDVRAALERRLGYTDALLTVTEPHSFWAIEADPNELRATFAIDVQPESVSFAPDIGFYRERKLRLLNGAHTATAPLALLAGVRTVREAADHPQLGAFLRHILFEELVPATELAADAATAFARTVIDRFRNPWLDHEWRVIATNQTAKLRLRVVPALVEFGRKRGGAPQGLALGLAAYLRWIRSRPGGDADLPLIDRHWRAADPDPAPGPVLAAAWERLAASALPDAELWGANLADLAADTGLAGCVVGAGTVLDEAAAHAVIDAGARFVVSPALIPAVMRACRERDVPCMPGAFTPTELLEAWRAGAPLVKLFPAAAVGPGFMRDVLAPLPFLRLVPSGGVTLENAGEWIRAGAAAVSVGSALVSAALLGPDGAA